MCVYQATESIGDLAKHSDVILLSLPSEIICQEVLFGRGGVAESWKQTTLSSGSNEKVIQRTIIDHGMIFLWGCA